MTLVLLLLAAGLLLATLSMTVVWVVAVRIRNAAIVDVAWSALFAPLAACYGLVAGGATPARLLMVALVAAWSIRLAWHIGRRVSHEHPVEDRRYQDLRARKGDGANAWFFWFFQAQALAAVLLSLPFALIAAEPSGVPDRWFWAGLVIAVSGVAGEAIADRQLAAWRRDAPPGGVCDRGLWRHSRHPNYFFEWITWCGFATAALGAPGGWAALLSPALMLYLLLRVTGVPAAEASSLRSRGEAYRRYQQRTPSAFVPWFPRP